MDEGGVVWWWWGALTYRAVPTWGAQAKALIFLSEAGRKGTERNVANWKK